MNCNSNSQSITNLKSQDYCSWISFGAVGILYQLLIQYAVVLGNTYIYILNKKLYLPRHCHNKFCCSRVLLQKLNLKSDLKVEAACFSEILYVLLHGAIFITLHDDFV